MTGETVKFEKADDDAGGREQSTISFPYLDLDAAAEVAQAVYDRGGLGGCNFDELAAEMNQTISGAFRLKTGTARTFGLTERDGKSVVKLTELGRQIVQPDTARAARVEAFLKVPLYAAIYEKYRGHLLPPMKALEREMVTLGVSAKQADKARQAFDRSARQAGFFEAGDDRLVRPRAELPGTKPTDSDSHKDTEESDDGAGAKGRQGGGGNGAPPGMDPIIGGLLARLPKSGEVWPESERKLWLQLLEGSFRLIYKDKGDDTNEVKAT